MPRLARLFQTTFEAGGPLPIITPKTRACNRRWRRKNADHIRAYQKRYRREHAEEIAAQRRSYRIANRVEIAAYDRRMFKRRYKTNPEVRIAVIARSRIRIALHNRKNSKSDRTVKLLGCSFKTFQKHLEKQFLPGMSWKNYGRKGWHIDHKKPCAKFDLSDPAQQRKCFHYTNLQPMWAIDNLRKGKK